VAVSVHGRVDSVKALKDKRSYDLRILENVEEEKKEEEKIVDDKKNKFYNKVSESNDLSD
jgi:hypothetical protein